MESWQKLHFLNNKNWLHLQNESISLGYTTSIVGGFLVMHLNVNKIFETWNKTLLGIFSHKIKKFDWTKNKRREEKQCKSKCSPQGN
jgi:hypothetical protein